MRKRCTLIKVSYLDSRHTGLPSVTHIVTIANDSGKMSTPSTAPEYIRVLLLCFKFKRARWKPQIKHWWNILTGAAQPSLSATDRFWNCLCILLPWNPLIARHFHGKYSGEWHFLVQPPRNFTTKTPIAMVTLLWILLVRSLFHLEISFSRTATLWNIFSCERFSKHYNVNLANLVPILTYPKNHHNLHLLISTLTFILRTSFNNSIHSDS